MIQEELTVNFAQEPEGWADLSREEKNRVLYERQLVLLDTFLEKGAITRAQYEKSRHDLTEKMGCA